NPAGRRALERSELHRAGVSSSVLPPIPRLLRLFSALGAGGVPRSRTARNAPLNVVGIVSALAAEARHLGPTTQRREALASFADGTLLVVSGIGGSAAARGARALIDAGATALISWGMAGGLDPAFA